MSNRQQKIAAGASLIVLGSWLLHEAYEGSGKSRPWFVKFLPGA